jgi:Mrp family chromosome partitioning ATPase
MKRVNMLTSEKGGVGKSAVASALLDALRSLGIRVAAYDADGVASLLKVHGTRDELGSRRDNMIAWLAAR